jgi:acyl-CoA thioesterase FadM
MMSVRARVVGVFLRWLAVERRKGDQPFSRLVLRCWPWDCDVFRHMNNARYLSIMDLGRWHFILGTGLWREFKSHNALPVAARVEIDFRRSIKPFEKYVLETRHLKIGTKSVVVSQTFVVDGQVAAVGLVTLAFLAGGRTVEVAPVLAALPHLVDSKVDELRTEPAAAR